MWKFSPFSARKRKNLHITIIQIDGANPLQITVLWECKTKCFWSSQKFLSSHIPGSLLWSPPPIDPDYLDYWRAQNCIAGGQKLTVITINKKDFIFIDGGLLGYPNKVCDHNWPVSSLLLSIKCPSSIE